MVERQSIGEYAKVTVLENNFMYILYSNLHGNDIKFRHQNVHALIHSPTRYFEENEIEVYGHHGTCTSIRWMTVSLCICTDGRSADTLGRGH